MKRVLLILLLSMSICSLYSAGTNEEVEKYFGEEGKIIAYISGPSAMLEKLEAVFERDKGDVLDIVQMGCGPLRQRVWAEAESGGINADVFWGSDPLLFEILDERGFLEKYIPKGYENLAPRFQKDKSYILVNERYGVVIYNKNKVKGPISSFYDLTNSIYSNEIVHADPSQSSTALALIASLWDLEDPNGSFHGKLADNGLYLAKKNSDVPSKIQEGEFVLGIAPHDAVWRLKKQALQKGYETSLEICWPIEGAVAIQRPIAISNNASRFDINKKLTHEFVDFLISEKAQEITKNFGFISVLKSSSLPKGIPSNIKTIEIDWETLSSKQNNINESFENLF